MPGLNGEDGVAGEVRAVDVQLFIPARIHQVAGDDPCLVDARFAEAHRRVQLRRTHVDPERVLYPSSTRERAPAAHAGGWP
jgi:hypothetical protein